MSSSSKCMPPKNRKRLLRDVVRLIKSPLTSNGIYYSHDEDNMLKGYAVIFGPDDSLYRYGAYMFEFNYPTEYPFAPPKLIYLTNDGKTRFNPNLYRNGKVCISLLNTWKGEQWTSCQTIESILLSLVALLHNEPLINEPGIKKTHSDFKSYNSIIQYKNYEIAILGILTQRILPPSFSGFFPIIKKHFKEHEKIIFDELAQLEQSKKNKKEFKTSLYNMNLSANYTDLTEKMKIAFKEFLN
uniref:UBC core domain-containing protein n=1 Tax=viral metagenome TaxID=1070528 RepID=A0A6C0EP60_9ZZZZ